MATKNELLTTAKNNLDALGKKLGEQLSTTIGGDVDGTKLADVKKSFLKTGTLAIPDEVYEKIAEALNANKKISSIFGEYSVYEGECIKQVAGQIATLLKKIDKQTFTVKENGKNVKYTIEYRGSGSGHNDSGIRVSNGTEHSFLNLDNTTSKKYSFAKNAMAEYCAALYELGDTEMKKVLKECRKVLTGGISDFLKAVYSDAPIDKTIQKVLDTIKAKTKAEVKKEIKAALPKNSNLNDALTKYENLNKLYTTLDTTLKNEDATLKSISSAVTNFSKASTELNKTLKTSLDTFPNLSNSILYSNDYKAITVPSGLFTSWESTVKKVYAGEWTVPVEITCGYPDNIVIGGSAKNTIYGYDGNDSLVGGKSNDYLYGGYDNDTLVGNKGNDYLYGDYGNDSLVGGAGDDRLYGDYGNDSLLGGDGDDYLDDWIGSNYLNGGSGKDTLYGGNDNDTLFGGKGND